MTGGGGDPSSREVRPAAPADTPGASRPPWWALGAVVLALVLVAWANRFIQDDAFISFRYARNLVEGHGLVFNPGEAVEGYTNFLWTLLVAGGMALGLEPVAWSWALGLAAFAGSLVVTFELTRELASSSPAAFTAVVLLGTNYSFSAYATGGLETQLQALLVVAAVWLGFRFAAGRGGAGLLALASVTGALALLTRLDSAVCLAVPAVLVLARVLRPAARDGGDAEAAPGGRGDAANAAAARAPGGPRPAAPGALAGLAGLVLPGGLIVGSWLAWKVGYYGDVLPNTFYVKVASAASLLRGVHYVYRFLATYWLLPLVLVLLLARRHALLAALDGRPLRRRWCLALVGSLLLWSAYVASVGGDFMEFRFMVPALPLFMALLGWALVEAVPEPRLRAATVVVVLLGSVFHAFTFWGVRDIESVDALAVHMEPAGGDWDDVGRTLGEHFPGGDVSIAVGPAGAIPYYSGLPSVDMRGLVDPWVARNGHVVSTVPGHQRMAPLGYLVRREVDLVIGHPQVVPADAEPARAVPVEFLSEFGLVDADPDGLPPAARMVEIPMDDGRRIVALWLTPDPRVERAVEAGGWHTAPLVAGPSRAPGAPGAGGRP